MDVIFGFGVFKLAKKKCFHSCTKICVDQCSSSNNSSRRRRSSSNNNNNIVLLEVSTERPQSVLQ